MKLEELQRSVARKVGSYAVALMNGDSLLGSGTLSTLEGRHGVLTARHIFFEDKQLRAIFTANDETRLGLAYTADAPRNLEFEFKQLYLMDTHNWVTERWGPDLLFMALPESPQLQALKSSKSFVPLDEEPELQIERATRHEDCAWCLVCHPHVEKHETQGMKGSGSVLDAPARVSFRSVRRTHHHKGWDYLDIPVGSDESAADSPFGGVCGGGYWKTPLIFDGYEAVAVGEPSLLGVAYLEHNKSDQHHGFLRCHGPRSVYLKLDETIRIHQAAEAGGSHRHHYRHHYHLIHPPH